MSARPTRAGSVASPSPEALATSPIAAAPKASPSERIAGIAEAVRLSSPSAAIDIVQVIASTLDIPMPSPMTIDQTASSHSGWLSTPTAIPASPTVETAKPSAIARRVVSRPVTCATAKEPTDQAIDISML